MTRIGKKLAAVFLALAMAVTFIPVLGTLTAYAEGESNPVQGVYVGYVNEDGSVPSENLVLLNAETPYYVNNATSSLETEPESWNAYFDAETGTLTLRNYQGCTVTTRTNHSGDLKIILEGRNRVYGHSINGLFISGNVEITSLTAGTLSIETGRQGTDSCYGIRSYTSSGSIKLSGDAKVDMLLTGPASDNALAMCASNMYVLDNVQLSIKTVSEGKAYGFWINNLCIETPHQVRYEGNGNGDCYAFAFTKSISMENGASISIYQNGDSIEAIYNESFESLKEILALAGYGVTGSAEDGMVTAVIEPITDMETATVEDIPDQTYTGSAVEPVPVVRIEKHLLEKDKDFSVSYNGNINAGTATAVITGQGIYAGEISVSFTIVPAKVTVPTGKTLTYTGKSQTGVPVSTKYTVSGNTAINAGSYKATVSLNDKTNYTWSDGTTDGKVVEWVISAKTIKPTVVLSTSAYTWNGKVKKPAVTVKDGSTKLAASDYTVTYASGRKNVGKYTVTVKPAAKGNYTWTAKKVTFKINPKGTTLLKSSKYTVGKTAVTVKWNKQDAKMSSSRITGYQVQIATNSSFTTGKKTYMVAGYSKVSKKFTGLKSGKKYYVRIRTYKKIGDATYYSPWSAVKTVTTKK